MCRPSDVNFESIHYQNLIDSLCSATLRNGCSRDNKYYRQLEKMPSSLLIFTAILIYTLKFILFSNVPENLRYFVVIYFPLVSISIFHL